MHQRLTHHTEKPPVLPVVYLILSLCALATTSAAAILWTPIDADFITRADNAGWDTTMLLPHQMELSIVVNTSVLLTLVLVVTASYGVLASRRQVKTAR
ncbi:hypothetical protein RCH17_003538 [Arthrobacter sp. MP_M7]|nr:hypothetical protein [Arthrobacter sp. MP_M4]MEC5204706.1 hypothetical protein [Arthrobacter sp. MP_M7]